MCHSCLKENLIKVFEKLLINTEIWGLLGHGDRNGTKLSSVPHLRCCKEGTGKSYLLGPSRKAAGASIWDELQKINLSPWNKPHITQSSVNKETSFPHDQCLQGLDTDRTNGTL